MNTETENPSETVTQTQTPSEQETQTPSEQEALTPEKEKEIYKKLYKEDVMKKGDTYYLVSSLWWTKWREYIDSKSEEGEEPVERPGAIDNSALLGNEGCLKEFVREPTDYLIISEALWQKLVEWYGGGPAIQRKVIADFYNRLSVEVRLNKIRFVKSSDMETIYVHEFSKTSKVSEVKKVMCEKMGLKEDDVRIWDFHNDRKLKILTDPYETMEEARIINDQKVLFEEKVNGKFPKLTETSKVENREPTTPGLCGLHNLGNTCYMNSGIQCLSNCFPISDYLIKETYLPEINTDNPLGTKGELITEFAELIKEMWSGETSSIGPRDFKFKLERFAPQFSGYNQQDSHEFISCLLDGLHEDVNRIKKKQYIEEDDNENLTDLENSQKAWQNHKARNDSFIVDWCQGQIKSTIECPKCPKISIKFDPIMYLSLPLPQKRTREIKLIVVQSDLNKRPIHHQISVPKEGSIEDVKKAIAQRMENTKSEDIEICDVYNNKFFKVFKNKEQQSSIQDRDVIQAYCLPSDEELKSHFSKVEGFSQEGEIEFVRVEVIHKAMKGESKMGLFGSPIVMKFPSQIKYELLLKEMTQRLDRIIKKKGEIPFRIILGSKYGDDKDPFNNDDIVHLEDLKSNLFVCWDHDTLPEIYDETEAKSVEEDPSVSEENAEKEGAVNIEKCLELFSVKEQLDPENEWYCNKCKEHQRAYKKIDVWSLPKVLIIQLKRFSYKNVIFREKLETFVDFPLEGLDLSNFVKGPIDEKNPPIYDLFGISQHFGVLGGGHYTAACRNPNTKKWYNFDDRHVSELSEERLKSSSAYILFYQRRDTIDPNAVLGAPQPTPTTPTENNEQESGKEDNEEGN